ncbi:hypothetical protein MRX96_007566 [Rhipicephalus microplus]
MSDVYRNVGSFGIVLQTHRRRCTEGHRSSPAKRDLVKIRSSRGAPPIFSLFVSAATQDGPERCCFSFGPHSRSSFPLLLLATFAAHILRDG